MEDADQWVYDQAIKAVANRLKHAAAFIELHAPKTLFKKIMRLPNCEPLLVRMEWPGVLRVFDPVTGELLAESIPGKPDQPNLEFCPPTFK